MDPDPEVHRNWESGCKKGLGTILNFISISSEVIDYRYPERVVVNVETLEYLGIVIKDKIKIPVPRRDGGSDLTSSR